MTDYHVNPSSGANDNSGESSELALKNLDFAMAIAGAADNVYIAGSDAKSPIRSPAITAAACNVYAQGSYMLPAENVSEGATRTPLHKNFDLSAWTDTSTPWGLTVTAPAGSTVAREGTTVPSGSTYCAKLVRSTATPQISWFVPLPKDKTVTVSLPHQESAAGKPRLMVVDAGGLFFNFSTGEWQAGAAWQDYTNSQGSFSTEAFDFTTDSGEEDGTYYEIRVALASTITSYIGPVTLSIAGYANTYNWADDTGTTSVLSNVNKKAGLNIYQVLACTTADWDASGISALSHVAKQTSIANCRSDPGSWFWNSADSKLYFTPESGVSISDLHIEVIRNQYPVDMGHTGSFRGGGATIVGGTYNIFDDAGAFVDNVTCLQGATSNIRVQGGTAAYYRRIDMSYTWGENNVSVSGAGVIATFEGCVGRYAWDDGFQSISGAGLICIGCLSSYNGQEEGSGNDGFGCEETDSYMEVYNCTAVNSWKTGFRIPSADHGTCVIKNCRGYGNNRSGANGISDVNVNNATGVTMDNNCFSDVEDSGDYADSNAVTETSATALADYSGKLPSDSACVNAGAALSEIGLKVGANGEPYPRFDIDIGAMQSTHGPFHPVNL